MHRIEMENSTRGEIPESWITNLHGKAHAVTIVRDGAKLAVSLAKKRHEVATTWLPGQDLFRAEIDGVKASFRVSGIGLVYRLARGGVNYTAQILLPRAAELMARMRPKPESTRSRHLISPMPGLLVSLAVRAGQDVKAGEELAVVEAMKMENVLRAERDGTVTKLCVKPGDSLAADQVILEFA
jgi:propionyl-CoA carboxylase alpha chain